MRTTELASQSQRSVCGSAWSFMLDAERGQKFGAATHAKHLRPIGGFDSTDVPIVRSTCGFEQAAPRCEPLFAPKSQIGCSKRKGPHLRSFSRTAEAVPHTGSASLIAYARFTRAGAEVASQRRAWRLPFDSNATRARQMDPSTIHGFSSRDFTANGIYRDLSFTMGHQA